MIVKIIFSKYINVLLIIHIILILRFDSHPRRFSGFDVSLSTILNNSRFLLEAKNCIP